MMRRILAAVAGVVLAVAPAWADQDADGSKLMAAASYTLAGLASVGGQIEVQSPSSALFHPYGFKAWKVEDCVYAYRPSTFENGRVYRVSFRNLSGEYATQGSTLIFYGTGVHPPVCIKDGDLSGCLGNLVMRNVYNADAALNNTLYILKHGCAPDERDLPGNHDPHD